MPALKTKVKWAIQNGRGQPIIKAHDAKDQVIFHLARNTDGVTWRMPWVDADFIRSEDYTELKAWERMVELAFAANPRTAIYPWQAKTAPTPNNIAKTLRKQRSKFIKQDLQQKLQPVIDRIKERAVSSLWSKAALGQTPQQLWDQQGLYTDFQNWTIYRITIEARRMARSQRVPRSKLLLHDRTIDHIVWECEKVRLSWASWMGKWTGERCQTEELDDFREAAATRVAPAVRTAFLATAQRCIGRWTPHHTQAMQLLWHIWATITPVFLWRLRNQAIFEGKIKNERETQAAINAAGGCQVQAIANAWKKNPATKIQGLCLSICHSIMMVVDLEGEIPDLEMWNLHYHSKHEKQNKATGGWVLYHHRQDLKWHPVRAGSLQFNTTSTNTADAAKVPEQGITELLAITQPNKVYLRIATLDKKLQKQVQTDPVPTRRQTAEVETLKSKTNRIFSIQWEKPAGPAYKAVKWMAKLQQTNIYDIQGTGQAASPSNQMRDIIKNTSPEELASPTRQTNDILSRLIAYQASKQKAT